MTEGSVWRKIVGFAVPVFIGRLFQQLYNTADSLVVGQLVGTTALAAVSSVMFVILMIIRFFRRLRHRKTRKKKRIRNIEPQERYFR